MFVVVVVSPSPFDPIYAGAVLMLLLASFVGPWLDFWLDVLLALDTDNSADGEVSKVHRVDPCIL